MSDKGGIIEVELLDGTVAELDLSKLVGESWDDVWGEVEHLLSPEDRFEVASQLHTEALIDLVVDRGVKLATDRHLGIESELLKRHILEHSGTIRVCRDEICDLLVRLGGGR
ncbi:MAG: hypothetical protein HZY73_11175 [Micropruina sp.]|nr:MAG: hypothetical protein HZY73_11175 [Micropruina sp.]